MNSEEEHAPSESSNYSAYKKVFVENFVELLEEKVNNYESELQNKKQKSGTIAGTSEGIGGAIGGAAGSLLGFSAAGSAVGKKVASFIGNYVGSKTHKNKAGRINEFIYANTDDDFRKILIQGASILFECYECQFLKVSCVGGWSVGLNRMAKEAVDRLINYINCLTEEEEFSVDFITKAVVRGQSKDYLKNKVIKDKVLYNSVECKVMNIYNKVGLQIEQEDQIYKYYCKKNNESNTGKYGYRLPFDWEMKNIEEVIENYVPEDNKTEPFAYTKQSEEIKWKEVNETLDEINKIDPFSWSDIIRNEIRKAQEESRNSFDIMNRKCGEVANDLGELHKKTTLIQESLELSLSKPGQKGMPIWFDIIGSVKNFTGRFNELDILHAALQSENRQMVISQAAAISGLGGVGKSELARKYAEKYYDHYENVIWINSETQESLKESFQKLAAELEISIMEKIDINSYQEKNIMSIVNDVYKRLRKSKSLFIFDNAEEYIQIKQYLPVNLSPGDRKPYLLITSRNCCWKLGEEGKMDVLPLKDFSAEEAVDFIKTALKIDGTEYDDDIMELVQMLYCFPLALQQAQACIQEKNEELQLMYGDTYSIKDYITDYRGQSNKSDFLNFAIKHGNNRYVRTVYTTLILTLDNLRHKENGTSAMSVVEIMAYFASDRISIEKIFSKLLNTNKLWASVELLAKYSIINVAKGFANIHRLVQEVIRLELVKRKREINVLKETLKLINKTVNIIEDDITHFISIWKHCVNHDQLISEFFFSFIYGKGKNNILHLLSENGETDTIQIILSKLKIKYYHKLRKILNVTDQYGRTPLYMAVENNHLKTAMVLCNEGVNVDTACNIAYNSLSTRMASGWTPLHIAAYKGFVEIVDFLVTSCRANINAIDSLQRRPVDLAVDAGYSEIVKILNSNSLVHLLHAAVRDGKLEDVRALHRSGANLNAILANWTALHLAAFSGYLDIVKFLVENGATVDHPSDDGFTPLHAAASNGHLQTLQYLLSKISLPVDNIRNEDGWTLLHAASQNGHLEVVKFLIENVGQNKNITDKKYTTPLQTAAFHGKMHVVQYLLSINADINAEDAIGSSILIAAAVNYHVDILKLLLQRNNVRCNITPIKNETLFGKLNFTVLHIMAAYDGLEIVRELVEIYGMDVNVGEDISLTPLHVAAIFDSVRVIKYFINKGAHTNCRINVSNILDVLIEIIRDSNVANSSIKIVVSVLFNFVRYFRFAKACSFLLTPGNVHRGFGYKSIATLKDNSSFCCSFVLNIIFNLKPIKTHINYIKSYMDEKKSKNSYSGADSNYFTARVIEGNTQFSTKSYKLKLVLYLIFVLLLSIVIVFITYKYML